MGLDDFNTDKDDNESDDSDSETSSNDSSSVLDSFKTVESSSDSTDNEATYSSGDEIFGITPSVWNSMEFNDKIRHVRDNYVEDYYPSYQPDGRWSFERVVEITCVCDNTFTFYTSGVCLQCGRRYTDVGRTVRKIHESEDNTDNV